MRRASKERTKRFIPGFVIRGYHQIRVQFRALRFYLYHLLNKGEEVECPICDHSYKAFMPGGEDVPVLQKHEVSSAGLRPNCMCPYCESKERDRLLFLFLIKESNFLSEPQRVLHFAPEKSIKWVLGNRGLIDYVDADLDPNLATYSMDITKIPAKDNTFDLVICNHVLEHVPDDMAALKEMSRVLKPQGTALLQVPIARALKQTYEDPMIVTPEDRETHFGQHDHVRIYGLDFMNRLEAAGFEVTIFEATQQFPQEVIEKHALLPGEKIYICTKP